MRDHKLIRIFITEELSTGTQINLNKEQSHYIGTVMRHKISDALLLFNGADGEFKAEIISATKNQMTVEVKNQTRTQLSSPNLTLLYSPVKNAKNEFIVQKATEMGVKTIQPVITDNTVKEGAKSERLGLVAIEAAEQCERLDVPEVFAIEKLDKILNNYKDHKIMFCDETGQGKPVAEALRNEGGSNWAILIGPEGGFSARELAYLKTMNNVHPVGLGPRILRAETAIITAIALWQGAVGDFNTQPDFRSN